MTDQNNEMLTQSMLLDAGWTKTMILRLLPDPVLKQNPMYKNAAPMKLWYKATVDSVMLSDEYKKMLKAAEKRKVAAAKAVKTKTQAIVDSQVRIANSLSVIVIPDDELIDKTIDAKNDWYCSHDIDSWAGYDTNEETLNRWIVNYIRHNLIDGEYKRQYDYSLVRLRNKVGKSEAYDKFKMIVLDKIAEAYPKYAKECERQKQRERALHDGIIM